MMLHVTMLSRYMAIRPRHRVRPSRALDPRRRRVVLSIEF